MLKYLLLFCFFCLATNTFSQAVAPDLNKQNTLQGKVDAWRDYCNLLLRQDYNFKKVVVEGHKGLALVPDDSLWIKGMFNLFIGAAYENMRVYDSAAHYIENCVRLVSKTSDGVKLQMQALSRLNYVYNHTRNSALRNATINRINQIVDTTKRDDIKVLGVGALETYFYDIGDFDKSLEYAIRWIDYYKVLVHKDSASYNAINIGFQMNVIGSRFVELKQYDKAIDYLNQASGIIGNRALTGNEESLYRNYIAAFLGKGIVDSARRYYGLIYKGMAGRDTIYNVLSYANFLFGQYYLDKHNKDSAFYYTQLARTFGEQAPEKTAYITAGQILGNIYYERGNYTKALSLLRESLNNEFEFDRGTFAIINKVMADCYAKLNQWDSAYAHVTVYTQINDSLLNAAANTNFANAEAKYQNKEKQIQIAAKNAELKAQAIQRRWLIGGLALVAFIAVLLIIIYRNKKHTADVLDEKNKILGQLNNELEAANQTKAKLFSIISHDLRSPINQVYQFLKLQQLNPDALSQDQKTTLSNKIQNATGSLLETMEDLLLWSKTQMHEFKVAFAQTDVSQIIINSQKLLQLNSEAKQIEYITNITAPSIINTDAYFFETITRNLLQNAIKAAPQNSVIKIEALRLANSYSVTIENSGKTFSNADFLAAISNYTSDKTLSGLGLKLVAELSEKIGATIAFSNPDNNTTIAQLTIPVA